MSGHISLIARAVFLVGIMAPQAQATECGAGYWQPPQDFPPRPPSGLVDLATIVKSDPVIGFNDNGRLELFVVGKDGSLLRSSQDAGGNWGDLESLGAPANVAFNPTSLDRDHLAAVRGKREIQVFAIGGGAIWRISQQAPNARQYGAWKRLARFSEVFRPSGIWAAANQDGRVELFALNSVDRQLYHTWQVGTSGVWTGQFVPFGKPLVAGRASYAFATDRKGRLLVAAGGGKAGAVRRQMSPNSGWLDWENLGGPTGASTFNRALLGRNADGRLELVLHQVGQFHHTWQTGPDTWSGAWGQLGNPGDYDSYSLGSALATAGDGCLELVSLTWAPRGERWLASRRQKHLNSDWAPWSQVRWPFEESDRLLLVRRSDRNLELFVKTSTGRLAYSRQVPTDLTQGPSN